MTFVDTRDNHSAASTAVPAPLVSTAPPPVSPDGRFYWDGQVWQAFGMGVAGQLCGQVANLPSGVRLSSAGRRLAASSLDTLLFVVTLGIGYLIWSLVTWTQGQTPAKQLLHMRTVRKDTGTPAGFWTMALREVVGKGLLIGLLDLFLVGLPLHFMLLWDEARQELWDKLANTLVVDDPA